MQKKPITEAVAMLKAMFKFANPNLTEEDIRKLTQEEDDLMRFRVITGYSSEKAIEIKATLKCSLRRATDFVACKGVLPDEFHQLLLTRHEVNDIMPLLHGIGYNLN